MGNIRLYGSTSGYTELAPPAVAPDGVLSLPSGTGTIAKTTDQGLVHINTTTFSAVSSVSLNNVFSATYDDYLVSWDVTASTTADINGRFRTSGTDNSNSSYKRQLIAGSYADSVAGSGATGSDIMFLDFASGANQRHGNRYWISLPFATAYTTLWGSRVHTAQVGVFGCWFDATTSFDGISLLVSSGTITGTIRVYGYKNS